MKSNDLIDIIGDAADEHIRDAKKTMPRWTKWASAVAACLCLVICLATIIPTVLRDEGPEQHSTGAHLQFISTELVEWESNGFKGVVVYTGNSALFPVGAELTVIFREQNTEIVFDDGTSYGYGTIQIEDIGWAVGSTIDIGFGVYEEYDAEKGYDNKVYAYHVELNQSSTPIG